MTYQEALRYLQQPDRIFCNPGTQRVRALCAAFGNPQDALPVIHVAGTNGKGSFCLLLASVLTAAGYRVGRFSSPALCRINECITVDGDPVSDGDFSRLIEALKPVADRSSDRPTEFELLTVAAVLYFRERQCDFVILECGMGGETDATNIIDRPLLSVITGVSVDHASFLGSSVEEIAAQKAGIIKAYCPVLWCGSDPLAEGVCRDRAQRLSAPFFSVSRTGLTLRSSDLSGSVFDFGEYSHLRLSLLGLYQVDNGINVLSALPLLDLNLPRNAVAEGFRSARFPGRFEVLSSDPLLIADGGHNPEGIHRAVESIETYLPNQPVTVVSGIMADKDYHAVALRISHVAGEVFTVTPANPRSLPAEDYAAVFRSLGVPATPCSSVSEALSLARSRGRPVVCLGSLYLYAAVRAALEEP